jgi:predicted nucleic acid-binding protein
VILVDTSVWIEHLRRGEPGLAAALDDGQVLIHPFVVGELACGNIGNREHVLDLLQKLPRAREATHAEVMTMIDRRKLHAKGIGYADAHLLAAAAITPLATFWTLDKRLKAVAASLDLA